MASSVPLNKMKRSKSLNSLVESEYRWKTECDKNNVGDDSGVQADDGHNVGLERQLAKLSDICNGLTREVSEMTAQLARPEWLRAGNDNELATAVARLLLQGLIENREKSAKSGAKSLLNAIEVRPSLDQSVGDAVRDLLQSEELKQCIVSATEASIKKQVESMFSTELSALFMPITTRTHRQMLKHIPKMAAASFADLEEKTACNAAEAWQQTSQSLQAALQRHESLLLQASNSSSTLMDAIASTAAEVLEDELKQWRGEIFNAVLAVCDSAHVDSAVSSSCASTGAIVNTPLSPVDRMMITAEVMKLIKEGDVNGAFMRALLAGDLTVVAAACRAAAPAPALVQPVLLSLLQQLATDLLIDTALQCSYIEYALQNLNPADAVTRSHLPLVIGELQRHLSAFLRSYPHHLYANRISAIIDNARKLL